jgi:hypothetical protein
MLSNAGPERAGRREAMPFKKGESGNPKGAVPGRKRAKRGSALMSKGITWALKHMDDDVGKEGQAPSGVAKALLKEARENPSKFLDRAVRMFAAEKQKAAGGGNSPLSSQDRHYGEVIDRLLIEFAEGQQVKEQGEKQPVSV